MYREKVAGENFRDGSMEVAFELWIELSISRFQRRFPPLSGEAISEENELNWFVLFPHRTECRIFYSKFSKF